MEVCGGVACFDEFGLIRHHNDLFVTRVGEGSNFALKDLIVRRSDRSSAQQQGAAPEVAPTSTGRQRGKVGCGKRRRSVAQRNRTVPSRPAGSQKSASSPPSRFTSGSV
jgi:hypothetical protein